MYICVCYVYVVCVYVCLFVCTPILMKMFWSVTFASFHGATVSYSVNLELDSQVESPSDHLVSCPHRTGVKVHMVGFLYDFWGFGFRYSSLLSMDSYCLWHLASPREILFYNIFIFSWKISQLLTLAVLNSYESLH